MLTGDHVLDPITPHVGLWRGREGDPLGDYLASLEWIGATENPCLLGPAGTGKSHLLVALGHTAVEAGHRVRYFSAAELVETLYRGLADNSVGKVIDGLKVGGDAGAYERVSLGVGSHWPFDQWGRFLPEHTTAVSLLDRLLHHSVVVVTDGESFRMREARQKGGARTTRKS